jgi:methylmalonyl-CoA mutase cobalamin-binding domain/chain
MAHVIDPFGGSYLVEDLTQQLVEKARQHIAEAESLGGMAAAIEAGVPKLRIEEVATATQARIDSGSQTIVGVNKYQPQDSGDAEQVEVRRIDNSEVRSQQIARLKTLRKTRNQAAVDAALQALRQRPQALKICCLLPLKRHASVPQLAKCPMRWRVNLAVTAPPFKACEVSGNSICKPAPIWIC